MRLMTEHDLMLFMKSGVLKQFNISQSKCGRYSLHISLTIEKEEFILAGTRNKPREWASLDTLAKHIGARYVGPPPILLSLRAVA
ncbi:hypothetical protein [Variovorax sp. 770b2]|uniref:hypothetical protein n=1 Tax=Variovorax sp. 770b2 TaxID=1566271 RepID=UPI0008ED3BD2|nr:hypothetical protein [Variovorax sp. 770b2]SFQ43259.1 hypothetical protein SAMN03159339_0537 [Variovorax sp. 770b2]